MYRIQVWGYKQAWVHRIRSKWHQLRAKRQGEPFMALDYVRRYAPGRSFVDIGGMWGINGRYSFEAEAAGASRVVLVDIDETPDFSARVSREDSKVEFVKYDATSPSLQEEIGEFDVVWCFGVLYHLPDPLGFLQNLRRICKEKLILETLAIPEVPGFRNMATFFPMQPTGAANPWDTSRKGAAARQLAISVDYEPAEGYSNNFWGMTPSCVESLLKTAGFTVETSQMMSRSLLRHAFVARPD
jgi:SAM-dependent methyltransferase